MGPVRGIREHLVWKSALPSPSHYLLTAIQPQIPTEGFPPLLLY